MKKLSKFRVKYLRLCSKIVQSKYAKLIPYKIRRHLRTHNAKTVKFNDDADRWICPFCNAFVKHINDCKACGAVFITNWWYRR